MARIVKPDMEKNGGRYIEGIGRRKSAVARVRIYPSSNKPLKDITVRNESETHLIDTSKLDVTINGKRVHVFFGTPKLSHIATAPLNLLNTSFKTTVCVEGGGTTAQAEAIRLGLARALERLNEKWRQPLKEEGYLTRDSRAVERKKPGLRKARRPQQWRKR